MQDDAQRSDHFSPFPWWNSVHCRTNDRNRKEQQQSEWREQLTTLLDLCVSSKRWGHSNLLCIVPNVTGGPRRESERSMADQRKQHAAMPAVHPEPALRHGTGLLQASASVNVDGCKGSAESGPQKLAPAWCRQPFSLLEGQWLSKRQIPHCVPVAKRLFLASEWPATCSANTRFK